VSVGRQIIETKEFTAAVEKLGGARFVDEALSTVMEALVRNPYAFPKWESDLDFLSFRWVRTTRIGPIPPLVFIFRIEKETVYLEHVEEEELGW
jgi:hypothetical protein